MTANRVPEFVLNKIMDGQASPVNLKEEETAWRYEITKEDIESYPQLNLSTWKYLVYWRKDGWIHYDFE